MQVYKNHYQKYALVVLLTLVTVIALSANLFAAGKLHISDKDIDKIAQEVSSATGMEFKEFPKVEVVSIEEYLKEMGYESKEMITQFSTLGHKAFSVSMPLRAATYSWYSGKIYCIKEYNEQLAAYLGISASGLEKIAITREMVRAVDNQYYDFKYYLRKMNSTESLRILQMMTHARGYQILAKIYPKVGIGNAEYKKYFVPQNPEFSNRLASYEKILAFLNYVMQKGVTVEALYYNPPLDGVQILFPEKYLAGETIVNSTMEEIFTEEDFTLKLPWNFRNASCNRADHLELYNDIAAHQAPAEMLSDYLDGIYCYYSEKLPGRPKDHYPIDRNSTIDYSKGMLSVSLYKYATPEGAKKLVDLFGPDCLKMIESQKDEFVDFNIDKIKARFPENFFVAYKGKRGDIAMYLVVTVDGVNLVEMNLINMNPTEDQILQVIDLVLERMNAKPAEAKSQE